MKQKDILREIRLRIDDSLKEQGFVFKNKFTHYLKFNKDTQLYFGITFMFLDSVDYSTGKPSKNLELCVGIYHKVISQILLESSNRSFLESIFYFKIAGNMLLSDIVLNPDINLYTRWNNYNYFKLAFVDTQDLEENPSRILSIINQFAIPFFDSMDTLLKIKNSLDRNYEKTLPIHNVNNERLLALVLLLHHFHDEQFLEKIERIRKYFVSIDRKVALEELDRILKRLD